MHLHALVTLQAAGSGTAPALSGAWVTRGGKCTVSIALTLLAPAAQHARVTVETSSAPAQSTSTLSGLRFDSHSTLQSEMYTHFQHFLDRFGHASKDLFYII